MTLRTQAEDKRSSHGICGNDHGVVATCGRKASARGCASTAVPLLEAIASICALERAEIAFGQRVWAEVQFLIGHTPCAKRKCGLSAACRDRLALSEVGWDR
jgi:hypothetical protein